MTLIKDYFFIYILFLHWIADFICQTDYVANNKSSDNTVLLQHILIYSLVMLLGLIFCDHNKTFYFIILNSLAHLITDFFTSRLNTKLWNKGKIHYFFVSIGFDQFLHTVVLFVTYNLLLK